MLGCFKDKTFELYLNKDVKSVLCKPRILPFSLKDRVSDELNRLLGLDLLVPVETSD